MKVWCGNLLSIGQRSRCLVFDAAGRPFSEYFRYRGSTNNCQGFCIVLEAYERIRSAAALPAEERDLAEEQQLEDFQRQANALLVTPPGTATIKDYPQKTERSSG
jgi:hypothetical protein